MNNKWNAIKNALTFSFTRIEHKAQSTKHIKLTNTNNNWSISSIQYFASLKRRQSRQLNVLFKNRFDSTIQRRHPIDWVLILIHMRKKNTCKMRSSNYSVPFAIEARQSNKRIWYRRANDWVIGAFGWPLWAILKLVNLKWFSGCEITVLSTHFEITTLVECVWWTEYSYFPFEEIVIVEQFDAESFYRLFLQTFIF